MQMHGTMHAEAMRESPKSVISEVRVSEFSKDSSAVVLAGSHGSAAATSIADRPGATGYPAAAMAVTNASGCGAVATVDCSGSS